MIGYFFRSTKKDRERRNLLLLLTPHVIEGPDDFRVIFKRKLEEHREFVARFQKDGSELKLGLDYGKKHGIVEAIHQSIRTAREEEEILEKLRNADKGPELPQDIDGVEVNLSPTSFMQKLPEESQESSEKSDAPKETRTSQDQKMIDSSRTPQLPPNQLEVPAE